MDIATQFKNYLGLLIQTPGLESNATEIFGPHIILRHNENNQLILAFTDFSFFCVKEGELPVTFNLTDNDPEEIPKTLRETIHRALENETNHLLTSLGAPQ